MKTPRKPGYAGKKDSTTSKITRMVVPRTLRPHSRGAARPLSTQESGVRVPCGRTSGLPSPKPRTPGRVSDAGEGRCGRRSGGQRERGRQVPARPGQQSLEQAVGLWVNLSLLAYGRRHPCFLNRETKPSAKLLQERRRGLPRSGRPWLWFPAHGEACTEHTLLPVFEQRGRVPETTARSASKPLLFNLTTISARGGSSSRGEFRFLGTKIRAKGAPSRGGSWTSFCEDRRLARARCVKRRGKMSV